jgi:hypothetical protein
MTSEETRVLVRSLSGPIRPPCVLCGSVPAEGLDGYRCFTPSTGAAICFSCSELSGSDLASRIDAALRKAAGVSGKSLVVHKEKGLEDGETWGRCIVCCVEDFGVAMTVDLDWESTGKELFCLCSKCAGDESEETRMQVLVEVLNALEVAKGQP